MCLRLPSLVPSEGRACVLSTLVPLPCDLLTEGLQKDLGHMLLSTSKNPYGSVLLFPRRWGSPHSPQQRVGGHEFLDFMIN